MRGALKQDQAIVRTHAADRATVANALLRMGMCYQRLGDQQATTLFQRIVREFPEQKEAASAASARGSIGASLKRSLPVFSTGRCGRDRRWTTWAPSPQTGDISRSSTGIRAISPCVTWRLVQSAG